MGSMFFMFNPRDPSTLGPKVYLKRIYIYILHTWGHLDPEGARSIDSGSRRQVPIRLRDSDSKRQGVDGVNVLLASR